MNSSRGRLFFLGQFNSNCHSRVLLSQTPAGTSSSSLPLRAPRSESHTEALENSFPSSITHNFPIRNPNSPQMSYPVVIDDKDLDDAALWAVIDSATASHSSSKCSKPLAIKYPNTCQSPSPISKPSPPANFRSISGDGGEVVHEPWAYRPPRKVARTVPSEACEVSPLAVVRNVQRTLPPVRTVSSEACEISPLSLVRNVQRTPPPAKVYSSPETYLSPEIGKFGAHELSSYTTEVSPRCFERNEDEKENSMRHSLSGRFPSVSLFKEYQNAAMAILEKTDYTLISGNPFIKKTGWRKISCFFNISYEIRDKNIEFDEKHNVQRAEFVIRAYMQGGRFSDGWGSCDCREKRFQKPNHDIPSTAETRAKNKACQDLLGIGEYRPGATSQVH